MTLRYVIVPVCKLSLFGAYSLTSTKQLLWRQALKVEFIFIFYSQLNHR